MSLESSLTDLADNVGVWLSAADFDGLFFGAVAVAVFFWLRKPLARLVIAALNALLTRLSVGLSPETRDELIATTSVLIVTLAAYIAVEVLNLPELAGGLLRRVLASVAIIAVFAGWYNLCGPFVTLLSGDRRLDITVETGWMERVARFAVVLFGITALLTVWQLDISGALTGVGVLGAGLAIATQDLIRNLVAGMNNLSEKRFAVGDTVQIEGAFIGTVEQIDLRSTLVRGFDQIPRYVPNSDLSNAVVMNYSQMHRRRVLVRIPFVLSLTPERVSGVCADLKDHLYHSGDFDTSDEAPKYVNVEALSDTAIVVMFYARTRTAVYKDYLDVVERLTLRILEISRDRDAGLAYPTQTIHLHDHLPTDPGQA